MLRMRLLRGLAAMSARRPWTTVGLSMALAVVSLTTVPYLRMDAGHSGLVDAEVDFQQHYVAFQHEFGSPDHLVVMVEGGDEPMRRALIDRLEEILPADGADGAVECDPEAGANAPGCVRDVFGRVDLQAEGLTSRALLYLSVDELRSLVDALESDALGLESARELRGLRHLLATMVAEVERRGEGDVPDGVAGQQARATMDLAVRFLEEVTWRVRDDARAAVDLEDAIFAATSLGATGQALDRKGYASSRDGRIKLVVVRPMVETDDPVVVMPFVGYVRASARAEAERLGQGCDAARCPDGPLRVTLTGLPAIIADEADSLLEGTSFTGVLAAIGVLLVLLLGFRSLTRTVLALVPLLITLILTVGFTQVLYGGLNMVTAACIPVLLGLCIDSAVHLLARFDEGRAEGLETPRAMMDAVVGAGPGLLTGAFTTSGAFFALAISDLKAFRELGVITGAGLLAGLLLTLTLIPALAAIPWTRRRLERSGRGRPPFGARAVSWVPGLVARAPALFVVVGTAIAAVMLLLAQDIPWSYDYADLLPDGTESTVGARRLVDSTEYSGEVGAVGVGSLDEARSVTAALERLDTVERVESVVHFLPDDQEAKIEVLRRLGPLLERVVIEAPEEEIDLVAVRGAATELMDALEDARFEARRAEAAEAELLDGPLAATRELLVALDEVPGPDAAARLARVQRAVLTARDRAVRALAGHVGVVPLTAEAVLAHLPPALRDRFASAERYALYAYPTTSIYQGRNLERFVAELRSVAPGATGFAVTHLEMNQAVRDSFRDATLIAVFALFFLLLADFRRIRYALMSMVPLAIAVAWGWGAISVLGISYNVGNIVALPLVLGIAVDSGVHILHRFRQEGGEDVAMVVRHTGRAVMLSGLTTIAGFAALTLASHKAMQSFGLFLVLGISAGLLSAVCYLPAILQLARRRLMPDGGR